MNTQVDNKELEIPEFLRKEQEAKKALQGSDTPKEAAKLLKERQEAQKASQQPEKPAE